MTEKGPAVLLPPDLQTSSLLNDDDGDADDDDELDEKQRQEEPRSAIAQMLYTRWLHNLRAQRESLPSLVAVASLSALDETKADTPGLGFAVGL